jgi:N-acetylglucosaminyldiphosphoundecaprenol N-acetyl-beta-D-mannosaminyltransferase
MRRVELLGLPVDAIAANRLLDHIDQMVAGDAKHTIASLNVELANLAAQDAAIQAFFQSVDLCYTSCRGVRAGSRVLGNKIPSIPPNTDWIWRLAAHAENRWRLAWIGGEPGVTHQAADILKSKHPDLHIHCDNGFHRNDRYPKVIEKINAFAPDVLLVGMGSPLQEKWVHHWRRDIDASVVWCTGPVLDFVEKATGSSQRIAPPSRGRKLLEQGRFFSRLANSKIREF